MTRAKFKCVSVTKSSGVQRNPDTGRYEDRPVYGYKFQAVVGGSEENDKFFASTPSGNVELVAVRDDLFDVGKEYYLDFTPVEAS